MDIPKKFGNYQFSRLIDSHKRFCSVFVAQELSTGREYACKMFSRSDPYFQLVEQEVRVHQMLHHHHVAPIHEVIYLDSSIIVIMDYYQNGDLLKMAKDLMPSQKLKIFAEVVDAVKYIHSHGVAHLDIKPDNVFIDDDLGAQLADFGSCETEATRNIHYTNLGTLDYRAPEMFKECPGDHRPADIWSLGIMFYALTTGSLPWLSDTNEAIKKQILKGKISYCTYLPQSTIDIIDRCCTYEPSMRITASELNEMLQRNKSVPEFKSLPAKPISRNPTFKLNKTIHLNKPTYHTFHSIPKMTITGVLPNQRVMQSNYIDRNSFM